MVIVWLGSIFCNTVVGADKRRGVEGFVLGLFLGPIGLVVTMLLPVRHIRKCPECQFGVPDRANRSGHCGAKLSYSSDDGDDE